MYQLYPFLDLSCQEIYVWNYSDEYFVEDLFLIDFKSLNLETQSNCNLGPTTYTEREEKEAWCWKESPEEKHQVKAEVIEVLKEKLNIQTEALTDSLKAASNAKKESLRKAGIEAALGPTRQLLDCAQQEMEKWIGKKPKLKKWFICDIKSFKIRK